MTHPSSSQPKKIMPLHAFEIRLSDQKLHRIRLIAACLNTSPAKFYRDEIRELIASGVYDEDLTGHE